MSWLEHHEIMSALIISIISSRKKMPVNATHLTLKIMQRPK
jgi:hypothetical protein